MDIIIFSAVFCGTLFVVFSVWKIILFFIKRKKYKKYKTIFKLSAHDTRNGLTPGFRAPGTRREETGMFSMEALGYLLIGARIPLSPARFARICLAADLTVLVLVWILFENIIPGVICALVFWGLALGFPVLRKRRIRRELIQQMPDALGMIVRGIKVGQSVDAALKDVAESMPDPFRTEIRIIYEEIRMGLPFDQAMANFEKRYPGIADIKIFCTAFIIQRETGGSLVRILEGLGDTIKKRFHFQRQVKTFSAEARTSAVIIGLMPLVFIFFIWIFNPEYIAGMICCTSGRILAGTALGLEAAGFAVMHNMARIDI